MTGKVKEACDEAGRPGEATCFLPAQCTARTPLRSHLHSPVGTRCLSQNSEEAATLATVIVFIMEHLLYVASGAVSEPLTSLLGYPGYNSSYY